MTISEVADQAIKDELGELFKLGIINHDLFQAACDRVPQLKWDGPGSISDMVESLLDEVRVTEGL